MRRRRWRGKNNFCLFLFFPYSLSVSSLFVLQEIFFSRDWDGRQMRKKKRNMQKEERYVLYGEIGGKGRLTSLEILIHNLIQVEREEGEEERRRSRSRLFCFSKPGSSSSLWKWDERTFMDPKNKILHIFQEDDDGSQERERERAREIIFLPLLAH